jgi:hypothetical protein
MSDDDRGTKPPGRPGAGASGTPSSIGKALGGDLDFEPDALLDSLMNEAPPSPAPAARRARTDSQPPFEPELTAAELDSVPPETGDSVPVEQETLRPSDPDDEVTLIGHREQLLEGGPLAPAPPPRAKMPVGPDSTAATPLVQRPPPTTQSIPGRGPASGAPLRPPPGIPRPAAGTPPAVSVPGHAANAPAAPASTREPQHSETSISTAPPPALGEADALDSEAPESQRTSLTDDEIAALDELESLSPPSASEPPTNAGYVPRAGTLPKIPSQPASVSFGPAASSTPPSLRSVAPRAGSQAPRLPSGFPGLELGGSLPKPGHPDEWTERAEWVEAEARRVPDAPGRWRALVVASEIWALAGNLERARTAAQDANTAARAGVAGRQLRWLAAAAGDWKLVASTLEHELRGAPQSGARAHAAYLDAEIQRLCLADDAAANQRFELLRSSEPDDPRAHLAELGAALGTSARAPEPSLPPTLAATRLGRALEQSRGLRTGEAAEGRGAGAAFGALRRALARGDRLAAVSALREVAKLEGLGEGAAWFSLALLSQEPSARAEVLARTLALTGGPDARLARRALAARAVEQRDPSTLASALEPADDAFTPAERLVIAALTGQRGDTVESLASALGEGELAPLGAAVLAVAGKTTPEAGSEALRAAAALGRALARSNGDTWLERLEPLLRTFVDTHAGSSTAALLELELATARRRHGDVAAALGRFGEEAGEQPAQRDRALARALVTELGGDREGARIAYADASEADPSFEAALRARLDVLDAAAQGAALAELASSTSDGTHGALLLLEAAQRVGALDATRVDEWLERAVTLEQSLAIAFRTGEQQARAAGDAERLAHWLKTRRELSPDDVERGLDLVREALLLSDSKPD